MPDQSTLPWSTNPWKMCPQLVQSHMSRPGIGLGWDGGLAQAEGASPTIWDKKPFGKWNRHQGKGNWTEVVTAWQPGDVGQPWYTATCFTHVHTATETLLRSTRDILEAEIPTQQAHSGPCTRAHPVRLYVRVSRELNQSTCPARVPRMEHKPLKILSTRRSVWRSLTRIRGSYSFQTKFMVIPSHSHSLGDLGGKSPPGELEHLALRQQKVLKMHYSWRIMERKWTVLHYVWTQEAGRCPIRGGGPPTGFPRASWNSLGTCHRLDDFFREMLFGACLSNGISYSVLCTSRRSTGTNRFEWSNCLGRWRSVTLVQMILSRFGTVAWGGLREVDWRHFADWQQVFRAEGRDYERCPVAWVS